MPPRRSSTLVKEEVKEEVQEAEAHGSIDKDEVLLNEVNSM